MIKNQAPRSVFNVGSRNKDYCSTFRLNIGLSVISVFLFVHLYSQIIHVADKPSYSIQEKSDELVKTDFVKTTADYFKNIREIALESGTSKVRTPFFDAYELSTRFASFSSTVYGDWSWM